MVIRASLPNVKRKPQQQISQKQMPGLTGDLRSTFLGVSVAVFSFTSGPESSGILRIMFSSFGSSRMIVGEGIDGMF